MEMVKINYKLYINNILNEDPHWLFLDKVSNKHNIEGILKKVKDLNNNNAITDIYILSIDDATQEELDEYGPKFPY